MVRLVVQPLAERSSLQASVLPPHLQAGKLLQLQAVSKAAAARNPFGILKLGAERSNSRLPLVPQEWQSQSLPLQRHTVFHQSTLLFIKDAWLKIRAGLWMSSSNQKPVQMACLTPCILIQCWSFLVIPCIAAAVFESCRFYRQSSYWFEC